MIQAILFDIDGTLLDTHELVLRSFEHTLTTHQIPPLTREELMKVIGPGAKIVYAEIAPNHDSQILFDTHRKFQAENTHLSKPFTKTVSTLQELKKRNIKMSAITTRSSMSSVKTLKEAGIFHFFDTVLSFEDVKRPKPHPEGLLTALSYMKIKPENAAMVGDTEIDIQAGRAAGTKTVGITTGMRGKNIAAGNPDFVINNIAELLTLSLFA